MAISGRCLCGAVRYQAAEEYGGGHCHCIDCRKTSGTGHGSHMIAPEQGFEIEGETKSFAKAADSGNMVHRHFCPNCCSAIYSTNAGMPGMVFIRASSLDDLEQFRPQMVVYTNRAASWDAMDEQLPAFELMPSPEDMPDAVKD